MTKHSENENFYYMHFIVINENKARNEQFYFTVK